MDLARRNGERAYEKAWDLPYNPGEGEDVILVDSTLTINPPAPAASSQPTEPQAVAVTTPTPAASVPVAQPVAETSPLSTLAKLGIGAALIGTGAGIPAGVGFVLDAIKPNAVVEKPAEQPVTPPAVPKQRWSIEVVP